MMQKSAYIILLISFAAVTLILILVKIPYFQSIFVKTIPTPIPTIVISTPSNGDIDHLIAKAKMDLAARLKIDSSQINLISTAKKDWPDSSLGCPEEGKFYSQIVTSGYLIVLEAEGSQYNYHTSLESIVFCK